MSGIRTALLLAQGSVMYPVAMRFAMVHDPGLAAQPAEVRERRLRTGPVIFGALMLGAGVLSGDLPAMSFLWLMVLAVGWSMKRHPGEVRRLVEGKLPSNVALLDILLGMVAAVVAVALGTALG